MKERKTAMPKCYANRDQISLVRAAAKKARIPISRWMRENLVKSARHEHP